MPKEPRRKRKKDLTAHEQNQGHSPNDAELTNALAKTKWGKTYLTNFLDSAQKNVRISYVKLIPIVFNTCAAVISTEVPTRRDEVEKSTKKQISRLAFGSLEMTNMRINFLQLV